ncbi:MAG TPA: hypothetical protein VJ860_11310, partial [Polyangia bacterium]|nr:hypothetical protein [Polyangia bacterium]
MFETGSSSQNLPRLRRRPGWLRLCTALFGFSAVLWANPAWGQTTSGLTQTDFALILQAPNGGDWVDLSSYDAATYLNQARCQCASPVRILVQMASVSRSKLSGLITTGTKARLYVGMNCAQLNTLVVPPRPQCPDTAMLGELDGLSALSANG